MRQQRKARIVTWGIVVIALPVWSVAGTSEPLELDCVVTPSSIVEVSTAVPGVLANVLVDRSDRVDRGQLLAELASHVEIVERDLAQVRSEMTSSVELWKVNVAFDNRNFHRLTTMKSAVSAHERDAAEREALTSKWRLKDAFDNIRQRELELNRAEAVLDRRRVKSPIDGLVLQRLREPGEYVENQPVLRIAQLNPLFVEVILPMTHFGTVDPGMQASLVSEGQPDIRRTAEVVVVDGVGDAASGTFGVRLALQNPDFEIPSGVKCRVRFDGLRSTNESAKEVTQANSDD